MAFRDGRREGSPQPGECAMSGRSEGRRGRRWLALSVRVLMVLVVLLAVVLARVTNRARAQRRAVATIRAAGGEIIYDFQSTGRGSSRDGPDVVPAGPRWLRHILGDEYFQDVVEVRLWT